MKPIIKQEQQDTILTSDITDNYIVCAVSCKNPYILTRDLFEKGDYRYRIVSSYFIDGNQHAGNFETIEDAVNFFINEKIKVEVFLEKDWKLALQWLIDNA